MIKYSLFVVLSICIYEATSFDRADTFRVGQTSVPFPGGPFFNQASKPTKSLGAGCQKSEECLTAFAQCQQNVCQCRPGFQNDAQSRCAARKLTCPIGNPLSGANGQPTACTIKRNNSNGGFAPPGPLPIGRKRRQIGLPPPPPPYDQVEDSCPGNYFCLPHSLDFSNKQEGHCCPKPSPQCPVGEPDTRYSCSVPFATQNTKTQCPYQTHYCTTPIAGGPSPNIADTVACCPKPCPMGSILHDGVCYGPSRLGESCQVEEQCFGSQARCVNGKCACGSDQLANKENTFCIVPTCPSAGFMSTDYLIIICDTVLKRPNGSFRTCQQDRQCGANAVCVWESFCCPEPEPFCPDQPGTVVTSPKSCNPMQLGPPRPNGGNNGSTCPRGQFCFNYNHGGREQNGICCSQGIVEPFTGIAASSGQSVGPVRSQRILPTPRKG